jgi:uncharacterized metal-binding protein YceD (DUF177 family)
MAARNEFNIPFSGLALGNHLFDFDIKDKFFEALEYSEIKKANIQVKLDLLKQSTMLVLNFELIGSIHTNCDRCDEEFDLHISGKYKLIVKFSNTVEESDDDDIITLSTNESEIDVSQFLYEYIILSIPARRVHPDTKSGESGCDKKVIDKLNNLLIEEEKEDKSDPRWDALKNIKLN